MTFCFDNIQPRMEKLFFVVCTTSAIKESIVFPKYVYKVIFVESSQVFRINTNKWKTQISDGTVYTTNGTRIGVQTEKVS